MRRNCPQCGTAQYVADEKLLAAWIFLKCHECGGTAAFNGRSSASLSEAAGRPLRSPASAQSNVVEKASTIEEANSASVKIGFQNQAEVAQPVILPAVAPAAPTFSISTPTVHAVALSLPPIPEFLRPHAMRIESPLQESLSSHISPSVRRSTVREFIATNAISLGLALICLAGGIYLIESESVKSNSSSISTDLAAPAAHSVTVPIDKPLHAQAAVVNRSPAIVPSPVEVPLKELASTHSIAGKVVEVRTNSAVLRSGPGKEYRQVGSAKAELQLMVAGVFSNWIEVHTAEGSTAWIRNDLVRPVGQVAFQGDLAPKGAVR